MQTKYSHLIVVGRHALDLAGCLLQCNAKYCAFMGRLLQYGTSRSYCSEISLEPQDIVVSGPVSGRYMSLMKNMSYSHTVKDDESESTIHTPGLSFESIDRDGNPSMPSLMRFVTTARVFASHINLDDTGRTIFDWARMTSDRLTFVASSEFTTDKELYDISVPKNPLDVRYQLGYIGTSSVSTVTSVVVPSTGKTILQNTNQLVGMDKKSRRPTPLPDWWKEKHGGSAIFKDPLIVPKMELSFKPFPYKVKVAWSHTDTYNHTNYTFYVYYCINALHYAIENGLLKNITKDVVKCGIKSMRNKYIGESLENDELVVQVWESNTKDRTVHFDIQKWGNSIFQSTFAYH